MVKKDSTLVLVGKSLLGILILLLIVGVSGAIATINETNATDSRIIQGIATWVATVAIILYQKIRKRSMQEFGICKVTKEGLRNIFYCIPVIVLAALPYIQGPREGGIAYVLASLFMALGVGFEEELYFRGYVYNVWKVRPEKTAIIVTSILFGVTHIANIMAGQTFFDTILQIVFAFSYGIVFTLMYIIGKSLWPCIFIHFFHDFSSFVSDESNMSLEYKLAAIQTVILIIYMIMLLRQYRKLKQNPEKATS